MAHAPRVGGEPVAVEAAQVVDIDPDSRRRRAAACDVLREGGGLSWWRRKAGGRRRGEAAEGAAERSARRWRYPGGLPPELSVRLEDFLFFLLSLRTLHRVIWEGAVTF